MARIGPGDFELTMDELRVVARYAVESAEDVLPLFEKLHPDDRRARAAIEAAWTFVYGAERSRLQRVTALDAHRAAKHATTEAAKHAAHAAGDAAAAAYLHPLADATQVGHIPRTRHERPSWPTTTPRGWAIISSRRPGDARRRRSSTCSSATRSR